MDLPLGPRVELRYGRFAGKELPARAEGRSVEGNRRAQAGLEQMIVLAPRPIGPGRIERGYQRRIAELERAVSEAGELCSAAQLDLASSQGQILGLRGELEVAARLERGLQRHADKLEQRLETAEQREKRLVLALGALQKENELLRERLALASGAGQPALAQGAKRVTQPPHVTSQAAERARARRAKRQRSGLLARWLGRGRSA
jgi:hypothetical protein